MLIDLQHISKSFGAAEILKDINLKIEDHNRIGLIGVNGAGKTTLLSVITGELQPDEGTISTANGLSIGYLKQNAGLERGCTIWEEMRSVYSQEIALEQEMKQLQHQMAEMLPGAQLEAAGQQYAHLQEQFEMRGGYQIDVNINRVLNGMGFEGKDRNTIIQTLSGGEKTRLAICKLLLESPQLLILDEPTNHLDFKTLLWLEDYLSSYKGALLIVSHDRYFLNKLVTDICELERKTLVRYRGNYASYVVQKEERLQRLQKEYDKQQREIADLKDYIAKNLVRASTTAMAQSRRKTLEKMELIEKPYYGKRPAKLHFEFEREPVKDILHVSGLRLEVGQGSEKKVLAESLDLDVLRGQKIAIIGVNGIGKSTFLKVILEKIPHVFGDIEWGKNCSIGYFDQEHTDLHAEKTVLNELWDRFPRKYEQEIRTALGNVQITGEEVYKKVGALSGGERSKLKFAILMMEHPNVLVLDEPTNHLDLATKDALDQCLSAYQGTILAVSHDRYLLNTFPSHIAELTDSGFTTYEGKFDQYLVQSAGMQQNSKAEGASLEKEKPQANEYYRTKKQRSLDVARRKRIQELEQLIENSQAEQQELEQSLQNPEVAADYKRLEETCKRMEELKDQAAAWMDEWIELNG